MTDAVVHFPVKLELMSRFHNRNFELLEPYDAKVSRTVLRGEGSSNAPDLLDVIIDNSDYSNPSIILKIQFFIL